MKGARRRILAAAVIVLAVGGAGAIFLVDYFGPSKSNIRRLGNPDKRVQQEAVKALAQMGQTAVPALAEALKHKDSVVRTNAAQALVQIGPKAKAAVPALAEALKDKEPSVRGAAAEALRKIEAER
jgi:HEAT repeat protein